MHETFVHHICTVGLLLGYKPNDVFAVAYMPHMPKTIGPLIKRMLKCTVCIDK